MGIIETKASDKISCLIFNGALCMDYCKLSDSSLESFHRKSFYVSFKTHYNACYVFNIDKEIALILFTPQTSASSK